jgi:hypothetical protein
MSDLEEVWMPVPNYESFYQVSNSGKFAIIKKDGRVLRKLNTATQYLSVSCKDIDGSGQKALYIHQLVAHVFIGKRPDGMVVRHIDGNRYNNHVSNLCYGSPHENTLDSIKNKTYAKERNGRSLLNQRMVNAIRSLFNDKIVSKTQLAKAFQVSESTINAIIKNRNWKEDV